MEHVEAGDLLEFRLEDVQSGDGAVPRGKLRAHAAQADHARHSRLTDRPAEVLHDPPLVGEEVRSGVVGRDHDEDRGRSAESLGQKRAVLHGTDPRVRASCDQILQLLRVAGDRPDLDPTAQEPFGERVADISRSPDDDDEILHGLCLLR